MDSSSIAQQVAAEYNLWTFEKQQRIITLAGTKETTAFGVMKAVREITDQDTLARIKELFDMIQDEEKRVDLDDLLSFYTAHENIFSITQKHIMAGVATGTPVGNVQIPDSIITSSIVTGKPNDVAMIRLERTMKHCHEMYKNKPEERVVFPGGFYHTPPPPPHQLMVHPPLGQSN